MTDKTKNQNRLAGSSSPYLQQHASNPVDWYPWSEEAFELARREDKPVFLSIGYSTCHWCHVMAHESFEDEEVAGMLNQYFVSVKLDREERPDLDQLYMSFVHALTGRGGWPMSVFLTPGRKPFFAGTYFPKHPRGGQTGFMDLLNAIHDAWSRRKDDVLQSAEEILHQLKQKKDSGNIRAIPEKATDIAFDQLSSAFDSDYGGFGEAPKFPTPHHLLFLLRYWKKTGYAEALWMAEYTLKKMRYGGICDQLGGGFHRYSTDRHWRLPHFEKMLYDQALLSMAFTEAFQITGKDFYRNTGGEILDFVLVSMTSPEGGFWSAYDADSEGEEGRFYLWSETELMSLLGPNDFHFVKHAWNTMPEGNHADESSGRPTGLNILYQDKDSDVLAYEQGISVQEWLTVKKRIQDLLIKVRNSRVPPFLDDKILTDWNGLMIAALAKASASFGNRPYLEAAESAWKFVNTHLRDSQGRLLKSWRNGRTVMSGHLDDYAFIIWGLIELYEVSAVPDYLREAVSLTNTMIADFWDSGQHGFYLASGTATDLILRNKECSDGAYPSGNSVAAHNLIRLGRMTGNTGWIAMAGQTGAAFADEIRRAPSGFTHYLSAFMMLNHSGTDILVTGNPESHEYRNLVSALGKKYLPDKTILYRDDRNAGELHDLAPFLLSFPVIPDGVRCYICKGQVCESVIGSASELDDYI